MKKCLIIFTVFLLVISLLSANESNGKRFFVSLKGNYLSPSDSGYKDIYGSGILYPSMEMGFKFIKNIYVLAGYGQFTKNGKTPVLEDKAKSTQKIAEFGVGYWGELSDKFGYRSEAGATFFSYKEEALGETVSGSKTGFFINGGVVYNLGRSLFATFSLGYNSASDTVNEVGIKLGGFNGSLGIGVRI